MNGVNGGRFKVDDERSIASDVAECRNKAITQRGEKFHVRLSVDQSQHCSPPDRRPTRLPFYYMHVLHVPFLVYLFKM